MARKKEMALEEGEMLDDAQDGSPRVYELGFHIDPELPTEEAKQVYQALRSGVSEHGTLVAEGEPLKIPLAYTISRQDTSGRRDFNSAYFAWFAYETTAVKHNDVLELVQGDKRVVRFIDIITTKDAARHAAEVRALQMQMPQTETEVEADAELDAALESVAV